VKSAVGSSRGCCLAINDLRYFYKKFFILAWYIFALHKMQHKSSLAAGSGLFRLHAVCPVLFDQFTFLLSVRICSYTLGSVVPTCFYNLQYVLLGYKPLLFLFLHLFYSHTICMCIYIYICIGCGRISEAF
jgi:hypothetical protein